MAAVLEEELGLSGQQCAQHTRLALGPLETGPRVVRTQCQKDPFELILN